MTGLCLPQLTQPLRLWEKIELVIGEDSSAGHYVSRIEDFAEDGIRIDRPEMLTGNTLLRDNADLVVFVTREDAVYQFSSRIRKLDSGRFFLTMPGSVTRVQRRRFVRIDISEAILYALAPPPTGPIEVGDFLRWLTGYGLNLSGGGILLRTSEEIVKDRIVLLKVPVFSELKLPETVAAICRRTMTDKEHFRCGLEFADVSAMRKFFPPEYVRRLPRSIGEFNHRSQAILVDYVFKHQISLRKKGLL